MALFCSDVVVIIGAGGVKALILNFVSELGDMGLALAHPLIIAVDINVINAHVTTSVRNDFPKESVMFVSSFEPIWSERR